MQATPPDTIAGLGEHRAIFFGDFISFSPWDLLVGASHAALPTLAAIFILATQMTARPCLNNATSTASANQNASNIIQPKKRVVAADIVPIDAELVDLTTQARLIYGKGALNFTDCCSCVVAKRADEPLLIVGKDFAHTDIESAR